MSDKNKIPRLFEHNSIPIPDEINKEELVENIFFKGNKEKKSVEISIKNISTSYYIGLDWIDTTKQNYVCVEPKLISANHKTDYLKMFDTVLKHSDCIQYVSECYEIKIDEKFIEIEQKNDFLTPLLIMVLYDSIVSQIFWV